MFAKISEGRIHLLRWSLTIGWLLLIASLFFDPISAYLTEPSQWLGTRGCKYSCRLPSGSLWRL